MSRWNRYIFAKNLFKETLIIFKSKNGYLSISIDKDILNYISISVPFKSFKKIEDKKINYIIFDNLEIIKYKEFDDNMYKYYYIKVKIIYLYKYMIRKL